MTEQGTTSYFMVRNKVIAIVIRPTPNPAYQTPNPIILNLSPKD